ncbi:hypothetical protein HN873_002819 [Arachis hypogaea]
MNCSDDARMGTVFNGAIHWSAFRHDVNMNVIVAFDLAERTISEVPVLIDFETDFNFSELWVHGESLW